MVEAASGTGSESTVAAARMTTGAVGGKAGDPVVVVARVRGIGGKPKCC